MTTFILYRQPMKILMTVLLATMMTAAHSQNYKLERTSDLFEGCGFIHNDKYSFKDTLVLIQELLKTKFEGDKACSAPLAQLNSQLVELDNYFNRVITEKEKKEMYKQAQKDYLIELESELLLLNPSNPADAARAASLQSIIDSVKMGISTLGVESQLAGLEDERNKNLLLSQKWANIYANSAAAITTLNTLPDNCVDKMGGWKNMIPVVMKLASSAGPLVGGIAGGIVSAGFEAGGQVAILLRNNRIKRAISETNRVQNAQIIACTYSILQTNACELKRAKDLMDDKKKINDLINQRITDTQNAEYEAFYLQLSRLPRIQEIFRDIGSMGSALTLDLELLARYFAAVRLKPDEIQDSDIPGENATDDERTEFLIAMKARGLGWSESGMNGPIPLKDQVEQVRSLISSARSVIISAQSLMTKKRSFLNLRGKIIENNQFVINEIRSLHKYVSRYLSHPKLPRQYRADFKNNEIILNRMIDFLDYDFVGETDQEYAAFVKEIDVRGTELFEEISRGSVAQITAQTVLMIPDIAFESFNRPFKHLEKNFITQDILLKDDPTHRPYTDFVINRSMQSKFNSYPNFHGSGETFRDITYLAARNGLEKGFKREIIRTVKDAMEARADELPGYEGKTARHLCALYSSFLKEQSPKLFQKCRDNYKTLGLLPILSEANRPTEMTINYEDPCFYNSYKQEEAGQRRLFEKLIDYGSRNNLTLNP